MTVDLNGEELEMILLALKQFEKRTADAEHPATNTLSLIARLEQYQRDQRRGGQAPA